MNNKPKLVTTTYVVFTNVSRNCFQPIKIKEGESNMPVIEFNQGDIFANALRTCDVIALMGTNHMGMQFGIGYGDLKRTHAELKLLDDPFQQRPCELIRFDDKYLICFPGDFMSDNQCQAMITALLSIVSEQKLSSIALTGVRDSIKQVGNWKEEELVEIDNARVRFIVHTILNWIYQNTGTTIQKVLLIAMSDNFTRNFHRAITI